MSALPLPPTDDADTATINAWCDQADARCQQLGVGFNGNLLIIQFMLGALAEAMDVKPDEWATRMAVQRLRFLRDAMPNVEQAALRARLQVPPSVNGGAK